MKKIGLVLVGLLFVSAGIADACDRGAGLFTPLGVRGRAQARQAQRVSSTTSYSYTTTKTVVTGTCVNGQCPIPQGKTSASMVPPKDMGMVK